MQTAPSDELLEVAALMREALRHCILPYFGKLEKSQIGEKGPQDFVTVADTAAEAFLSEHLIAMRHGSRVVGEEGTAADPSLLETLGQGEVWIIDPVDGTLLFKNDQARFGTLVSRSQDGETQAGWILETFETGAGLGNRVTMGDRVSGVWHSPAEGEPFVRLAPFTETARAHGKPSGHISTNEFIPGFLLPELEDRISQGSSAFDWSAELYSAVSLYNSVILGDAEVYIAAGSMPWDHGAGAFLIGMLGGVALHLDDETPYHPVRYTSGVLTARDKDVVSAAKADALQPAEGRRGRNPDVRKS